MALSALIESDRDRVFLNLNDFGETITITTSDAVAYSAVPALVYFAKGDQFRRVEEGESVETQGVVTVAESYATQLTTRSTVTARGKQYAVLHVAPAADGVIVATIVREDQEHTNTSALDP